MDEQAGGVADDQAQAEVFVLSISHRHGEDHWVHRTEDGAWNSLAAWVRECWDEVFDEDEPIDRVADDDIVDRYFDRRQGETWDLDRVALLD